MSIPNAPQPPMQVSDQVTTPFLGTILRYLLSGLGFLLTNKGFIDADTWQTIAGGIMAAAPILYGTVLSIKNKRKLVTAAASASDKVAVVVDSRLP